MSKIKKIQIVIYAFAGLMGLVTSPGESAAAAACYGEGDLAVAMGGIVLILPDPGAVLPASERPLIRLLNADLTQTPVTEAVVNNWVPMGGGSYYLPTESLDASSWGINVVATDCAVLAGFHSNGSYVATLGGTAVPTYAIPGLEGHDDFWGGVDYRFGEGVSTPEAQTVISVYLASENEARQLEISLYDANRELYVPRTGAHIVFNPGAFTFELRTQGGQTYEETASMTETLVEEAENNEIVTTMCGNRQVAGYGTALVDGVHYTAAIGLSTSSRVQAQAAPLPAKNCKMSFTVPWGPRNDTNCPADDCEWTLTIGPFSETYDGQCRYGWFVCGCSSFG